LAAQPAVRPPSAAAGHHRRQPGRWRQTLYGGRVGRRFAL